MNYFTDICGKESKEPNKNVVVRPVDLAVKSGLALGLLVFKINFPGEKAMKDSISISGRDYRILLHYYRTSTNPAVRARAHILLLHERVAWSFIAVL